MTVSLDGAANQTAVKGFLNKNPGQTLNFLASDDDLRASSNPFGLAEAIPLIKIFDRQGKLRETIVGSDEARIDRTVQSLLAEK